MPEFTKQEYMDEMRKLYAISRGENDTKLSFSILQSMSIMSGVGRKEMLRQEEIRKVED